MRVGSIVSVLAAFAAVTALVPRTARGVSSCGISAVIGVSFGAYDVFDTSPLDSLGSVTYACQDVGPGDLISIDISAGGASSFSPRRMSSGANGLEYNLYLDAARTTIWGDGSGGSSRHGPTTPSEGSALINVYGRVPARQNAAIGSYSDTLIVTINF